MVGRFFVSTDDAYVRADHSALSAKVAGYVADLPVPENTSVKAGTVILRLDDGDFSLAVSAAQDRIALQDATIARIAGRRRPRRPISTRHDAKVAMAEADASQQSASIFERQETLIKKHLASVQALDQARANRDRGYCRGCVRQGRPCGRPGRLSRCSQAQAQEARRRSIKSIPSLRKAERDLAFTEIKAPFDGIIANRAGRARAISCRPASA